MTRPRTKARRTRCKSYSASGLMASAVGGILLILSGCAESTSRNCVQVSPLISPTRAATHATPVGLTAEVEPDIVAHLDRSGQATP